MGTPVDDSGLPTDPGTPADGLPADSGTLADGLPADSGTLADGLPADSGTPIDVPPEPSAPSAPTAPAAPSREPIDVVDVMVGATALAVAVTGIVGRRVRRVLGPAVGVLRRPPVVPTRYHADTVLANLAQYGAANRQELRGQVLALLQPVVPRVVTVLLEPIDLTQLVKDNVDLNEVVASVDMDEILARIDIAGMAEGVIAEVDLAEIIRQSTGSVASDSVRGVRMQSVAGDEAVGRAVGRIRLRFGRKVPATES